nr:MAG TPA: hypothetical protein [Bacteriophage sp.]
MELEKVLTKLPASFVTINKKGKIIFCKPMKIRPNNLFLSKQRLCMFPLNKISTAGFFIWQDRVMATRAFP